MNKKMTMGAMAVALLAAVGCSETETEIITGPSGSGDTPVALGISTSLQADETTKAVVSGQAITYDVNNYTNDNIAPGLGILVTNSGANGWYTPEGENTPRYHVWFMGDHEGKNWKSISNKGNSFSAAAGAPYYLSTAVGKVYAYYPYNSTVTLPTSPFTEQNLKISVPLLTTGTIDASTNNAMKYWSGTWSENNNKTLKLAASTENDYLYFAGTAGRNINNGQAGGSNPPASNPNQDATNPGYNINLDMKHALAMVSFRVYDGGSLSASDVNFTKFVIKNKLGGQNPFKTAGGSMSLVNEAISDQSGTGSIERTINNYILMRQIENGQQNEYQFIHDPNQYSLVDGVTVSRSVSAMVYPTTFAANDIEVVITLQEGNENPVNYTVTLPANNWEAGKNIIYTFSAGRNKLTLTGVSVVDWVDAIQPVIPL